MEFRVTVPPRWDQQPHPTHVHADPEGWVTVVCGDEVTALAWAEQTIHGDAQVWPEPFTTDGPRDPWDSFHRPKGEIARYNLETT